jgi:putative peptidoglycan lipid II flippase
MRKDLQNMGLVSAATAASRVLGLVRDICLFVYLGAGVWASAFVLAFTLPNLFRRLLGEGALTSAVVPVFARELENNGRDAAFAFYDQLLTRLGLLLLIIAATGALFFIALRYLPGLDAERWDTALALAAVLFPYLFFICLAAIICAGLQVCGRFTAAALNAVWLNLAMIAALLIGGFFYTDKPAVIVAILCASVLLGGLLQCLLPAMDLRSTGWRFRPTLQSSAGLKQVWSLFLPGVIGAAILQINILVSRVIAHWLDETAVSLLYLASRLMELPLGLFTIAVATVVFPTMARAVGRGDPTDFSRSFLQGVRIVFALSLAAGVGLLLYATEILTVLFQYGAFDAASVSAAAPIVAIYGMGLPFYSLATFGTRALHAHADMRTPVRIAAICLVVNVVLSLMLMHILGVKGLALANVIAAVVQTHLLWRGLAKHTSNCNFRQLLSPFVRTIGSVAAMGSLCLLIKYASIHLVDNLHLQAIATLSIGIPLGVFVFALGLWWLRFEEFELLREVVKRKFTRSRP